MDFVRMLIAALFAFFVTKAVTSAVEPGSAERRREVKPLPRRLMVRCASCGVYVLRDRALASGADAYYCSDACSSWGGAATDDTERHG